MRRIALRATALLVVLASLVSACADRDVAGPSDDAAMYPVQALEVAGPAHANGSTDFTECSNLAVPAGTLLTLRLYASGVQIYRWNGTAWSFVAPLASLTADAQGKGTFGSHYAGPVWESNSGSRVTGTVRERCTPDASAIPWLLLDATPDTEAGVFGKITFIQRVRTAGGLAPTEPGTTIDEEARVPYTTEYLFYRSR